MKINFKDEALLINNELVKMRRDFHEHPELGFEEYRTSKIIKDFLKNENIPYLEVAKTSAGAINYTPVAKVTNIANTIEALKKEGLWFVCADMGGETMYNLDLKGPIGLVIGNEGNGVSRLVKEKCDFVASIPMKGDIDSLNASVAAGVMAFEIVRQRMV